MNSQCPRCGSWVPDALRAVHAIQCRASVRTPNFAPQAFPSHRPPHPTLHNAPFTSQPVISPAPAINPSHIQNFRSGRSDSDSWRRKLEELGENLLRQIDTSTELRREDKQICSEYVNDVKVYQHLVVYTYAHLMSCTTDRWLLDELKGKMVKWKSWHDDGGDLRILRKCTDIINELKKLLGQNQILCPMHVSVPVTRERIVPADDRVVIRCLLVLCGRDHENEFYNLSGDQAQVMVDMLEQVLRDPSIDYATHARLLRYIIRLSRKSGRLPRQLLLAIEPRQMIPIGQGGSATIYQASYQHTTVAVKRSNLPHIAQCKEFVSEAVIWSHLKHENIVPFIGVVEQDRGLCLVSKFMYGGNVRTHLERVGRKNCDLRQLAEGVAKGLRYLHTLDPPIVHGDLKGYNVLIDSDGNACLVDFGISHTYDSRQILDSSKVGRKESLNWIAPEIINGDPESFRMTLETDMYAFACVLYEIYTGNIPFYKMNVIDCLRRRMRPPLQGLDVPIKKLIERCWQQETRHRMNATSAVEALQNMIR